MTEGTATSAATPAHRRKPRRKRNAGRKNEPSSQQKGGKGGSSKSGSKKSASGGNNNNSNSPPPPPQIKITIRNIQNSEKFGSVKSVLEDLVSKLIDYCVEKKANNQYTIELDRTAVRHLITEEEKIEERREMMTREKARLEEEEANKTKNIIDPAGADQGEAEKENLGETKGEEEKRGDEVIDERIDTLNTNSKLDVIVAPKPVSNVPTITARPLYVVPPRKTRRRGERGGTAYVLLIGPKIEKKNPTSISTINKDITLLQAESEPKSEQQPTTTEVVAIDESGAATAEDAKTANDLLDSTAGSKPSPNAKLAPEKVINYPQELAKGRLLLSNAMKSLIELATADVKTQDFAFSGCIVEQSMNGKTWKIFQNNKSRPDRREGTIESTGDYKEWLESIAKQKEELKARPKPVPGGGLTTTTNTTTVAGGDEIEEDGQPVSSLVQHLRAKKQDAKRKKSQKKKKKEENSKAGKSNDKGDAATGQSENEKKKRNEKRNRKNNSGTNGKKNDAAAAAKKAKRKKKERAKKKEKAKAAAAAAAASTAAAGSKLPTALFKPQASST